MQLLRVSRPGVMERLGLGPDDLLDKSQSSLWKNDWLGSGWPISKNRRS